jgi:hypothetical protein
MDTDHFKTQWLLQLTYQLLNIKKACIFPPQCILVFHVILTVIIYLISIRQLVSAMQTWCVFFEITIEYLNMVLMDFRLQRVKLCVLIMLRHRGKKLWQRVYQIENIYSPCRIYGLRMKSHVGSKPVDCAFLSVMHHWTQHFISL